MQITVIFDLEPDMVDWLSQKALYPGSYSDAYAKNIPAVPIAVVIKRIISDAYERDHK